MDRLNAANTDCLIDKIYALQKKKAQLFEEYNDPNTSAVDKYDLQKKIDSVTGKIDSLEEKIHKLARPENHFAEQTNDVVDATMQVTSEVLANVDGNAEIGMTELAETIFLSAEKVEGLDKSEIARIADKFNPLENAEMALEDDANMIDGIINNGSKEDLLKAQKELSETLDAMKDIVGNKHMMQSIREGVAEDIPNVEKQLEAVNKALEKFAPAVEDKGIINPDYYKSLPKEQRHIESMSNRQAEKVISALTAAEVKFSAVHRANEKTAITVAKNDVPAIKSAMADAQKAMEEESRQAWHEPGDAFIEAYEEVHVPENIEVRKPETTTINPDFYKSLTKDNRSISVETKENADKIMGQLEDKGIQFSASIRKNDTVAITVDKLEINDKISVYEKDADKNNILDAIAIVLPDETITIDNDADEKPDWWAFTTSVKNKQKYDGLEIGDFCVVVYDKNDSTDFIGKMAHELGHIMGLPDYYKYTEDDSYNNDGLIGPAGNELMDEGCGDLSACSKLLLGWLTEDDIFIYSGESQTYTITSMQYSPSCILIPRNVDNGYLSEYFLIEYVTKEANNTLSGGNGIRILHVETEVSDGKYGMKFKYSNNSQYYDKSNKRQRVLRLVNQNGYFYPGTRGIHYTNLIDSSIEGFHWYDEEGNLTVDTGLKIEIDGHEPGPDFDWSMLDPTSSFDVENEPSYIKGSTYQITISQNQSNPVQKT